MPESAAAVIPLKLVAVAADLSVQDFEVELVAESAVFVA